MTRDPETLTVAICADDRYAPGLIVTLGSILLYADPSVTINAVVLDCGITSHTWDQLTKVVENCVTAVRRQRLELMINAMALDRGFPRQNWKHLTHAAENRGPGVCLQRVLHDRTLFRGLPPGQHGSDAVYARLLLPELLSDVPTLVYVDSDVVFFKDIVELARVPLGECAAAACQDEIIQWLRNDCPLPEIADVNDVYFNSGVMLINLDYWRRNGVGRQAIEFLQRHGEACAYWDQTALNAVLVKKMRSVDMSWNRFGTADPDAFLANPFNVHLVSKNKPWLQPSANFSAQLWYVAYHAITGRKWAFS